MSAISCQQRPFGTVDNGRAITCYNLRNASGMTVSILNYGANLNAVQIPNIRGDIYDVTAKNSQSLLNAHYLSGATTAHLPKRYGITLDPLLQDIWEAESSVHDKSASVSLSRRGVTDLKYSFTRLEYELKVEYTLTATNELIIRSLIETSIPLPLFMTHHPLWNLTGPDTTDVNDHILQIFSDEYTALDAQGLTTKEYFNVKNHSAFNFRQPQRIIEKQSQILTVPYDACFKILAQDEAAEHVLNMPLAARVKAPVSGRILEVYTKQEGLRFYIKCNNENKLDGFCLAPMPLMYEDDQPSASNHIQQETCYRLIW